MKTLDQMFMWNCSAVICVCDQNQNRFLNLVLILDSVFKKFWFWLIEFVYFQRFLVSVLIPLSET